MTSEFDSDAVRKSISEMSDIDLTKLIIVNKLAAILVGDQSVFHKVQLLAEEEKSKRIIDNPDGWVKLIDCMKPPDDDGSEVRSTEASMDLIEKSNPEYLSDMQNALKNPFDGASLTPEEFQRWLSVRVNLPGPDDNIH